MDKWKTIALVLGGFSGGMVYMTACGDKDSSPMDAHAGEDDTADDGSGGGGTAPPAGGEGAGRAVFSLHATLAGEVCIDITGDGNTIDSGLCTCPAGFSKVGVSYPGGRYEIVCLED